MNKSPKKSVFPAMLHAGLLAAVLTFASVLGVIAALAAPSSAGPLQVSFSPSAGLTSLKNGSVQLLSSGDLSATKVVLIGFDGRPVSVDALTSRKTVDVAARTVTRTYSWGAIACAYVPSGNRLNLHVTISNSSPYIVKGIVLQLMSLKFPNAIGKFEDDNRQNSNVEIPTAIGADYGSGSLALANDDMGRPLYFGLPTGDPKSASTVFPVIAATYRAEVFPNVWMASPAIKRPIYPGEQDHLQLSVRVGPESHDPLALDSDVFSRFAKAYPPTLNWSDRRPIGYLMLSVTVPHPANGKNPRGWFGNDPTVDITTPEGLATFHQRLLQFADNSIQYLKKANAQGAIVWDIEGQEYPHAQSYAGDPRYLPVEMEPIADQFFKKFTDAGFRIGVTLRPQRPLQTLYPDAKTHVNATDQVEVADVDFNLKDKIAYAKKRWGCTLFYVDSDAHHDPAMSWSDPSAYELTPVSIFEDAAKSNPDCLIIPEQQDTRYYAYTVPYDELNQGIDSTPASVLRVYPKALTVLQTSTDSYSGSALEKDQDDLIQSVKRGDILLFRAWYETPELQHVIDIYKAAGR